MTDMFKIGYNASSARHVYEQRILLEAQVNKIEIIADRAQNPYPQDVSSL